MWSDNGTNFPRAARDKKKIYQFLQNQSSQDEVNHYFSDKVVMWKFIPQCATNFSGIWEAAVKSTKTHLIRVLGEVKLTYEELSTLLAQIESCLNGRPLASLVNDDDGTEALTLGHFIVANLSLFCQKPINFSPKGLATLQIFATALWEPMVLRVCYSNWTIYEMVSPHQKH